MLHYGLTLQNANNLHIPWKSTRNQPYDARPKIANQRSCTTPQTSSRMEPEQMLLFKLLGGGLTSSPRIISDTVLEVLETSPGSPQRHCSSL